MLTGSEEIFVGEIVKALAELKDQFVGAACARRAVIGRGDGGQEDENGKEEGGIDLMAADRLAVWREQ